MNISLLDAGIFHKPQISDQLPFELLEKAVAFLRLPEAALQSLPDAVATKSLKANSTLFKFRVGDISTRSKWPVLVETMG